MSEAYPYLPDTIAIPTIATVGVDSDNPPTIAVELGYSNEDPYAVSLLFHADQDEPMLWRFSRDLLYQGAAQDDENPTGIGDVRVRLGDHEMDDDQREVCVELWSADGFVPFWFPQNDIREFLELTYISVPAGDEGDYLGIYAGKKGKEGDERLKEELKPVRDKHAFPARRTIKAARAAHEQLKERIEADIASLDGIDQWFIDQGYSHGPNE